MNQTQYAKYKGITHPRVSGLIAKGIVKLVSVYSGMNTGIPSSF